MPAQTPLPVTVSPSPSILDDAAGTGELTETRLVAMLRRAAANDWRAAAWLLQHGPLTRQEWGDRERLQRLLQRQSQAFVKAIEESSLSGEQRMELFTRLGAVGIEPEAFDADDFGVSQLEAGE